MIQFVKKFRSETGQLPTLKDLKNSGFSNDEIALGIKEEVIEQFYVTLISGSIVKAFKIKL